MHQDPYAILHALLRAEAVRNERNERNEKSHRTEQHEESGTDKPRPKAPAQDDRK
ncbi:hypothetical protein [Streptomyces luteolus]|uniref:Transposase n=1 Tax=Streptomyces luteolus TaxID=3043615 RepID=A0ABT6T6Y8_9ACTN|nr:hypothetical protein [Streptomyces sp. B-S-A12]MDI3423662.1 hypothetical protein [Streptomyces sp. B-S-A12]